LGKNRLGRRAGNDAPPLLFSPTPEVEKVLRPMSDCDRLARRSDAKTSRPGEGEMDAREQINSYIADQPQPKREEMQRLHQLILGVSPGCRLWFLDGRDADGRIVSNPNIGYGVQAMTYANGEAREFYRIGLSANTAGISLYVMGLDDKTYLSETYGSRLGKATVTGYCVKFRSLKAVNIDVIEEMIAWHMAEAPA
jgi:hypothetical protein